MRLAMSASRSKLSGSWKCFRPAMPIAEVIAKFDIRRNGTPQPRQPVEYEGVGVGETDREDTLQHANFVGHVPLDGELIVGDGGRNGTHFGQYSRGVGRQYGCLVVGYHERSDGCDWCR
jgi:hypothetical protein